MISLGQKIKKARKEKGLTQFELADNQISRSMLSLLENGVTNPSMNTLEYIAKKLNKPLEYFFSESYEINERYNSLVNNIEILNETELNQSTINEIQSFINNILNGDLSKLNNQQHGTLYAILGIANYNLKDPQSVGYFMKAIEKLSVSDSLIYICKIYNYLGLIMFDQKEYKKMEEYLSKANILLENVTFDNFQLKLNISYNLALSYYRQQKHEDVINLIKNTLEHMSRFEIYFNFGKFNMLLALSYKNNNNINAAIDCNFKAIAYYNFINDQYLICRCYVNLSILYRILRDSYNSISYINKSITYFENINDNDYLINARVEKVITMFMFKIDTNSIKDIAHILSNTEGISSLSKGELLGIIGVLELFENNHNKALKYLQEAEHLIGNNINSEMSIFIYKALCEISKHNSNVDNIDRYQQKIESILITKHYYKDFFNLF